MLAPLMSRGTLHLSLFSINGSFNIDDSCKSFVLLVRLVVVASMHVYTKIKLFSMDASACKAMQAFLDRFHSYIRLSCLHCNFVPVLLERD